MQDKQTDKQTEKPEKSPTALREEEILAFWQAQDIFKKSLEKKATEGEFVFYEGPPTTNGKPGIHHLEARSFKDVVSRYKTMCGFHVPRKAGWDTHGLPVELQVEKQLGLTSKKEIEAYGIAEFNKKCKESVWEYLDLWQDFTTRIGYWVDQRDPYVTYHNSYIEAVWQVLKTVSDKNFLYKDYKVLPWCPRCGTALSSHELAQGYQDDKDLSVTAQFKVVGQHATYLLAWTTTPWTLPGNVALAVGPKIEYVKVEMEKDGSNIFLILAKSRLSILDKNADTKYKIIEEMTGNDLVGLQYEPLYPFLGEKFAAKNPEAFERAYQVYPADFVTTEDGTGIVHTAVMYGQEDFELGTTFGLPKHHIVNPDGHFTDHMDTTDIALSGRFVKDEEVAVDIVKDLAHRGLLWKKEKYEHSYPHCWRCKTPLIYYARDSWYIRMSSLRGELLAENEKVTWEPTHIKEGRFGEWLREAKDWAVSRERYWGTPLPVWYDVHGNHRVLGSIDELKKHAKKSGNHYFVMRHGETEGNVQAVWNLDSTMPNPLTDRGRAKIIENAKSFVGKIDLIVVSPFPRTQETARLVAETVGLSTDSIIVHDCLGEWNVGAEFDGKPIEEFFAIRNASPDRYGFKTVDGESYVDVLRRSGKCLYDLEKEYVGKNILIVTHGASSRALSLVAEGFSHDKLFQHLANFKNFDNAEIRALNFAPLPHNEDYELDLHKPFIDEVKLVDENGEPLTRVKEVMDGWFDSGSMPFAQYADERSKGNRGLSEQSFEEFWKTVPFPADYISEAIDQTRGWFYVLLCIGVLMGRGTPYKNVISLGHILDAQGKKMSKSLGNIVEPWGMMNTYGVDALRLWMYSVNAPGDSKNFDERTVDELHKKVILRLQNVVSFYEMYADQMTTNIYDAHGNVLDKWIWVRLAELRNSITESLDEYKIDKAARPILDFVDDLSTWYIRRSRDRFKSDDQNEKNIALNTTGGILYEFSKLIGPFMPFIAEDVYGKVKKIGGVNAKESVHLETWPTYDDDNASGNSLFSNPQLLEDMKKVRQTVTAVLEARQKAGMKVRQPLAALVVRENLSADLRTILAEEVNVKEVVTDESLEALFELDTTITPDLREEGIARDLIRSIQEMRKEKNLMPKDVVTLSIQTDAAGQSIVEKWKEQIMKTTNSGSVVFGENRNATKEVVADGVKFLITI